MKSLTQPGLESVKCNLCNGTQTRLFKQTGGMSVVQCTRCDLVYVNPRFDPEASHQHYNSGLSSKMQYYIESEDADRRSFTPILTLAELLLPQKGAILDIGPNSGTFLNLARERGWQPFGVEINAEAARYCKEQRGLEVIAGTLTPDIYEPDSFAAVFMGDVIEHLHDPLRLMQIVHAVLQPGGVVIISTPNIASRAGRFLQIKPEEHLYYFTPDTVAALLQRAGFEVVGVRILDRYRNITAMSHTTTLGGLPQKFAPLFNLTRMLFGDVVLKLPLRENLIAVARKPASSSRE